MGTLTGGANIVKKKKKKKKNGNNFQKLKRKKKNLAPWPHVHLQRDDSSTFVNGAFSFVQRFTSTRTRCVQGQHLFWPLTKAQTTETVPVQV